MNSLKLFALKVINFFHLFLPFFLSLPSLSLQTCKQVLGYGDVINQLILKSYGMHTKNVS